MISLQHIPASDRYALSPIDDTPIFYRIWNPEAGNRSPAIVLSDGIGCDGYVWKYLLPVLAPHARVIRWHYRGHGRTPEPRNYRHLAIADLARDLTAVLDDAEISSAVLAGHSMGVQVSLETALAFAERVSGLILLCGAAGTPLKSFRGGVQDFEALLPRLRSTVDRMPKIVGAMTRALVPTRLSYLLASRMEINAELVSEADFMVYLEGMARVPPRLFLTLLGEAARHSTVDRLHQIDVPALIVAGDRDGFTPLERSVEMHEYLPDAALTVVENGSHTAPIERPDIVERAVRSFLSERIAGFEELASGDSQSLTAGSM